MSTSPLPSPSAASVRSTRPAIPLLSLASPALALGDELAVGEPGDDNNAGEIWNVITRAADLVKDGERLENLAWRHWGQPRRGGFDHRRLSVSSQGTASTASIHTPNDPPAASFLHRTRSAERLSFGGALKLLLEKDESNFRDWVEDAKRHMPPVPPPSAPTISLPDTPVANFEIRLVEPTPAPSRVGSLGGSMNASGLLGPLAGVPPALKEVDEEEKPRERELKVKIPPAKTASATRSISPKKKGKFFVQSSPGKGSGSDSSHPSHQSPTPEPAPTMLPMLSPLNTNSKHAQSHFRRRSSGDSSTGKVKPVDLQPAPQRRHVSLSTMRGKYHAEKRRMAESIAKDRAAEAGKNEESGWEDEDEREDEEDWSDEEEKSKVKDKGKGKEKENEPEVAVEEEGDYEDEEPERDVHDDRDKKHKAQSHGQRRSSSRPRPVRSTSGSHHDLATLLTRRPSQHDRPRYPQREPPAPPAPTPLTKMSKRERQQAAAERAKIEAQLEAQRQREMFAKKQIFGSKPSQGLLASALQRGASMVNLHSAVETVPLRSSPTHGQLPSLASSPAPVPSLLRSKSAVAMPVQTGVSVTIAPHPLDAANGASKSSKHSNSSQERKKAVAELETSEEESDDDDANYLNTTQTRAKLAAMASKRDAKTNAQAQAQAQAEVPGQRQSSVSPPSQALAGPQALPAGPRLDVYGVVTPMSPTTRRRNIIMAEMSESLRRNVVLEREKSSGGGPRTSAMTGTRARPPPATHGASKLSTHSSAVNLTQYARGEPLERHNSHPARGSHDVSQPSSHTGAMGPPPPPPPEAQRRRTTPNLLNGANFLRPLTRVGLQDSGQPQARTQSQSQVPQLRPQSQSQISLNQSDRPLSSSRVQSSSNLVDSPGEENPPLEAPMMMRSSTDGDGLIKERERRRELARRRDTTDTSYRLHGW